MFPVYYNYNKTIYFAHANLEYKKFQLKGGYFWHLLTYGSTSPSVSFLPSIWLYPQWSFGNPQIHNPGVLTQHLGTEKNIFNSSWVCTYMYCDCIGVFLAEPLFSCPGDYVNGYNNVYATRVSPKTNNFFREIVMARDFIVKCVASELRNESVCQ